jgi:hypothetical protein
LSIGPQLKALLEKYPFSSSRVIAQHFLVTIPTVKEILQRELRMRKFSRSWVPYLLSEGQNIAPVEAAKEMLTTLQSCEANDLESRPVMSPGFVIYIHPRKCSRDLQQMSFQEQDRLSVPRKL